MTLSEEMKQDLISETFKGRQYNAGYKDAIKKYLPKVEALEKENESLKQQYKENDDKWETFCKELL